MMIKVGDLVSGYTGNSNSWNTSSWCGVVQSVAKKSVLIQVVVWDRQRKDNETHNGDRYPASWDSKHIRRISNNQFVAVNDDGDTLLGRLISHTKRIKISRLDDEVSLSHRGDAWM